MIEILEQEHALRFFISSTNAAAWKESHLIESARALETNDLVAEGNFSDESHANMTQENVNLSEFVQLFSLGLEV